MPDNVPAMAAILPKAELVPYSYTAKPLGSLDVYIRVTFAGIGARDIHLIDNDWGNSQYPLVPGHEVIGHIIAMGADVKGFRVGDVVGLNLFPGRDKESASCHGGLSAFIQSDFRRLIRIPEEICEKFAGPLIGGGPAVAGPLYDFAGDNWNLKGKSIGIIGIGGLGHLAIQFASVMGAETYAISRGAGKRLFSEEIGANIFINSTDPERMTAHAGKLDYLLFCTRTDKAVINDYEGLLHPESSYHWVDNPSMSAPENSSKLQLRDMLEFAAEHNIKPLIEEFSHQTVNDAISKIRDGSVRFRAVLKNDLV